MNLTKPIHPEEIIIATLATRSENGEVLLQKTHDVKPGFTKQALYTILRKLISEEIIVKHGMQFSLARPWIGQMYEFFTRAHDRYGGKAEGVDFLTLSDGDKISYSFKSPHEADRFWGHAFDVLADAHTTEPVYIYNPHEWFVFARQESELHLFHKIKDAKRQLWLTVGNKDPLDIYARTFFDGQYLQYHTHDQPLFDKEYYYLNIFGDYIIEAFIDPQTAHIVDEFYKMTAQYDEGVLPALQKLVSKGKTKLTISRNARKATKLKKLLAPYFFRKSKSPL